MEVSFAMIKADGTRRDFPMTKDRIVIGRRETCDLRVPLPAISREHCEILLEHDSLHLRDLGSSNGTFRNGTRVQECQLEAGDQIVIGPVTFTVVIDGEPAEIEPGTRMSSGGAKSGKASPTAVPDSASTEPGLDDSDDLSALIAGFDDDDSFAGFDLEDEET